MTVPTTTSRADYIGSGSTGPFSFSYRILAASHLRVIRTSSAGAPTTLINGIDYTITGTGSYNGGSITLTVALAVGESLALRRVVPLTQLTDYINQGAYYAETVEDALDIAAMAMQQIQDGVDRSLRIPDGEAGGDLMVLPSKTQRASTLLGFDENGNPIVAGSLPENANAAPVTATGSTQPRTLANRFADFVNVKDFGAVGDGVTDDTAAIQAAMNAAGNRRVIVPPGTYIVGAATIPAGLRLSGYGATIVCPASVAVDWWQAAAAAQNGATIEGLTFNYVSNTNGKHPLNLGNNARGWKILNCTFQNMKTRAAIRADYPSVVSGDGYITIRGCRFEHGDAAGAIAIYAVDPNMGVTDIVVDDCEVVDCGSSIMAIIMSDTSDDAGAGRFGAFVRTRINNVRMFSLNSTGVYGSIPMELWGHDDIVVSGCQISASTRGIGFSWCRSVVSSGNIISDQTSYAHEIQVCRRLTITGETVTNCKQFVMDTSVVVAAVDGVTTSDVTIVGNTVSGTGMSAIQANTYLIQFVVLAGLAYRNVVISSNIFRDPNYISGCIRLGNIEGASIRGNRLHVSSEYAAFTLVRVIGTATTYQRKIVVDSNDVLILANYTANNPAYNGIPYVIDWNGQYTQDVTITRNMIHMTGTSAGLGIGAIGANVGAYAGDGLANIAQNRIIGTLAYGINAPLSNDKLTVEDNDFRAGTVTTEYALGTGTVYHRRNHTYSGTAAPVAGTYKAGDRVVNRTPTVGQPKAWSCTVTGTPGTWVSEGNL